MQGARDRYREKPRGAKLVFVGRVVQEFVSLGVGGVLFDRRVREADGAERFLMRIVLHVPASLATAFLFLAGTAAFWRKAYGAKL